MNEPSPREPFGKFTVTVFALTLALGSLYLVRDFLIVRHGTVIDDYLRLGRDFVNVWHGGVLARQGLASMLYDLDAYRQSLWAALGVQGIYAFSYPPHSLLLAIPFSLMPYWVALLLWTLTGLGVFIHAARPYLVRAGLPWWLAALLPAGFVNIWAAHYGFFIGAAALHGWRLLDRRPSMSGLAFALMTIKPHLGLLIPPAMVARKDYSAIAWATIFSLLLAGASAILFGPQLWAIYVTKTLGFHASLVDAPEMAFHQMMPSTTVAMLRFGAPPLIAAIVQGCTALAALAIVMHCAMKRVSSMDLGLIAGTAIFLVLPYAFIYDMTVQSLAALIFATRAHGTSAGRDRLILALAFILPLTQMNLAALRIGIAPLILLAALCVQARIALSPPAAPATAGAAHSA